VQQAGYVFQVSSGVARCCRDSRRCALRVGAFPCCCLLGSHYCPEAPGDAERQCRLNRSGMLIPDNLQRGKGRREVAELEIQFSFPEY